MNENLNEKHWYVMRVSARNHSRSGRLFEILHGMEESGISIFRPCEQRVVKRCGKTMKEEHPLLGELFFANGTRNQIEEFTVSTDGYVQFKFASRGYHVLMTVPDREMDNFIKAVSSLTVKKYFMPGELGQLKAGTQVRVHLPGEPCDGVEGIFVRPSGGRRRCLLVTLTGMVTAGFEVAPEYLEKINNI